MFRDAVYNNDETEIIATDEDGKKVFIPVDPANHDYRLLMDGDADAGVEPVAILPYVAPPVIPQQKTRTEAIELALIKKGLITKTEIDAEIAKKR